MKNIYSAIYPLTLSLLIAGCGGDNGSDNGSQNEITVYISDGAKQCEFDGIPAKQTRQTLIDAGIDVLSTRCGHINGMVVITMCGAASTSINVHTIRANNLQNAVNFGFKPIEELAEGFSETDCRDGS